MGGIRQTSGTEIMSYGGANLPRRHQNYESMMPMLTTQIDRVVNGGQGMPQNIVVKSSSFIKYNDDRNDYEEGPFLRRQDANVNIPVP